MNRHETAVVLGEILNGCKELMDINFFSITDSKAEIRMNSTGHEIYIKCPPKGSLRRCLAPILAKNQLKMAELKEAIIIYKPREINQTFQRE